jgi:recombination protein RecT
MKSSDSEKGSQTAMAKAEAAVKRTNSASATGAKAAIGAFNAILERPEVKQQVIDACSRHVKPERMMALVRTIVSRNPRIAECTPLSVIGCLIDCTQLGLEPIPQLNHVYLIPYRNWKTKTVELQLQLGYQGMIALALRSGKYAFVSAEVVYENDTFDMMLGSQEHITHTFDLRARDRGEVIGAWAKAVHADGKTQIKPVTLKDIEKARSMSKDWSQWDRDGRDPKKLPVWEEHFDAMARKTAIRRLFPVINLPVEIQSVVQADAAIDEGRATSFREVLGYKRMVGSDRPLFDMPELQAPQDSAGVLEPPEYVDPVTGEVKKNA